MATTREQNSNQAARVVERSELITTRDEARAYYRTKLGRAHKLTVRSCEITIVFEKDATHAFSMGIDNPLDIAAEMRVVRRLPGRPSEVRQFNLERARLMDEILRAITLYTVAESGGIFNGREKVILYGPLLANGYHMQVVLRPGPGDAFTCITAYPVDHEKWLKAKDPRRTRAAKFPPEGLP